MERILIVEDSRAVSSILRRMIVERLGFEVVVARDLAEAKAVLDVDSAFLAAVLDLNLPDAPDGEVVGAVLDKRIPAIVLTGTFDEARRRRLLKTRIVDYLTKESVFSYEYLLRVLKRLDRNRSIDVLVVEDSSSMRAMVRDLLQRWNFKVHEASSADQALEVLEEEIELKLMIVDYKMPGDDGFDLTVAIRKTYSESDLAILGLSAHDDGETSAKFIKSGANDYLSKPFSPEEFNCRVMQNIEAIERLQEVRDSAYRDFLTKLHNRRFFFEEGMPVFHLARREQRAMSTALIDIDHFKKINDAHGHEAGDQVLERVATMLRHHFEDHLVARFGGEEFCILFDGHDARSARELLELFREDTERDRLSLPEGEIGWTVSIGLSDALPGNLDEMIKLADENLYRAKKAGRNQVVG